MEAGQAQIPTKNIFRINLGTETVILGTTIATNALL